MVAENTIVPISQALIVAIAFLGVGFALYRRMGSLAHNVESVSESMNKVEDNVREVDLKEMEKSILRIDWHIGDTEGGNNSVHYILEESGIEVVLSLSAIDREGLQGFNHMNNSNYDIDDVTGIVLEFEEDINTRAVSNRLMQDDELERREREMFNSQIGFNAISPFEMQLIVPTTSFEDASEFIPSYLDKIDQYHLEFRDSSEEFDSILESALEG